MGVALHDDVFCEEVGVVSKGLEEVGVVSKGLDAANRPTTADRSLDTEVRPTTQATRLSPSPAADVLIGQGMKSHS